MIDDIDFLGIGREPHYTRGLDGPGSITFTLSQVTITIYKELWKIYPQPNTIIVHPIHKNHRELIFVLYIREKTRFVHVGARLLVNANSIFQISPS